MAKFYTPILSALLATILLLDPVTAQAFAERPDGGNFAAVTHALFDREALSARPAAGFADQPVTVPIIEETRMEIHFKRPGKYADLASSVELIEKFLDAVGIVAEGHRAALLLELETLALTNDQWRWLIPKAAIVLSAEDILNIALAHQESPTEFIGAINRLIRPALFDVTLGDIATKLEAAVVRLAKERLPARRQKQPQRKRTKERSFLIKAMNQHSPPPTTQEIEELNTAPSPRIVRQASDVGVVIWTAMVGRKLFFQNLDPSRPYEISWQWDPEKGLVFLLRKLPAESMFIYAGLRKGWDLADPKPQVRKPALSSIIRNPGNSPHDATLRRDA